ncbi:unnamed protein product [Linum tenue]|uniref:Uncharacterized protein n=2 Tax=Linum tenue TaxID=586396 RepID=A0AAV0KME9_9ROSI|nr:unnamed protein product [Linum tenue]
MSYFRSWRWNRGEGTSSGSKGAKIGQRMLLDQNTRSKEEIPDRVYSGLDRVFPPSGTREKQKGARAMAINPRSGILVVDRGFSP